MVLQFVSLFYDTLTGNKKALLMHVLKTKFIKNEKSYVKSF